MFYYVYTDHAQYTIKTYAKMALFPLLLTGPLSIRGSKDLYGFSGPCRILQDLHIHAVRAKILLWIFKLISAA